ncbi:general substrate transporter [Hypoxylon trugodes]|uniref:general substrate transporter n=1 Tax=Hypoxylon trugodes TaxID=326681 RepID=UPI0021914090|nr:general substrate transporter [Hypoxylon trugodes]KAI1387353.1 general substrate transporter [Hypoxylon trugodes]
MYQASNVYFICGFAAIGGGLFGFDISSMSGVLGTSAYKRYFDNPVSYRQGGITAAMPAGSLVGSLASSFIADKFSRKVALQVACILWIIGSTIQCAAQNIGMLCTGRVIAGLCVGIASSIVPVYLSEVAPKEIRGRVVSLQQWAITWGILIQYFIQYGAAQIDGGPDAPNQSEAAFRIPWGIQMIPAFVLFIGLFFFPYSPRWLASQDLWEEAIYVMARLHGGGDMNHPKVLAEYKEIEEALRIEREESQGSFRALAQPRLLKRVILGASVQMWSQLSGINIMMYYIVYIMEAARIGSPLTTASIQYVINVALTLPAIMYLDKVGRRPSLIYGALIMMVLFFISGTLQAIYGQPNDGRGSSDVTWIIPDNVPVSSAIVAISYLYVATFATTWGPTSWTYTAEIFPSRIRATAVSVSTASNWFWNMVLAFSAPALLWNISWKTYMIFAAFNGAACMHMALFAHETKGKTLEEMDDVFDSGRPAWRPRENISRLDELQKDIERGNIRIEAPLPGPAEPKGGGERTVTWVHLRSLGNE